MDFNFKFKPGDTAWHISHGLIMFTKYEEEPCTNPEHLRLKFMVKGGGDIPGYQSFVQQCGRDMMSSISPIVYPLDVARKMGFPVPKEKKRVELVARLEKQFVRIHDFIGESPPIQNAWLLHGEYDVDQIPTTAGNGVDVKVIVEIDQ